MPKTEKDTFRHQDYDKILKEVLSGSITALLDKLCGIKARKIKMLPVSVPRTKEKRADFVLEVELIDNKECFIIHLEFQSGNDTEMEWRMIEYYEIFYRQHKLPIRQFVIYCGN